MQQYFFPAAGAADGILALKANLSRSPENGLHIVGEISGQNLRLENPRWYRQPLTINTLQFAGDWSTKEDKQSLRDFSLEVDGLAVHGEALWRRQAAETRMEAILKAPALPLLELARFLPDQGPAAGLKQNLGGGSLEIGKLQYAGPTAALATWADLPLQASFSVQDLSWRPLEKQVTEISFTGDYDRNLQLKGSAKSFGTPVDFAGTIEAPFSPQPAIAGQLSGIFAVERLINELPPARKPKLLLAQGQLPILCNLTGTSERLQIKIDADLTQVAAAWGEAMRKPAGLTGQLSLLGLLTPSQMELQQARLHFTPLDIKAKGEIEREKNKSFSLTLDLSNLDLAKIQSVVPLLEKLQGRGNVRGQFRLSGQQGQILKQGGLLHIEEAGFSLGPKLAQVSRMKGNLRLNGNRLESEKMTAVLGGSPITISGVLTDFSPAKADIHVQAATLRANELIFQSDQLLHDVEARLLLDQEGIVFSPVSVSLDGGTAARVRGTLLLGPPVKVKLDIEAAQADIDEVIALWKKPVKTESAVSPNAVHPTTAEHKPAVEVLIKANVGSGKFSGLNFQQATGVIHYGRGLLDISPLQLRIGPGTCDGRVAVEFSDTAPLLRTSGHLEKIDAAVIYQELLEKRGLITGSLNGDFYLEGRLGSQFLATSLGGFNIDTDNGVLRKFSVLGKVFSLLNVSQILTLQLPDMAREGMPFHQLAGTLSLQQGVLSSEDLFIDSPAMNISLVGELNLNTKMLDAFMGVKPLRTVDKIITSIPVAGWLLAGEEKALITAHFHIRGHPDSPEVLPVPITMVSEKVFGVFRRVLHLPGKLIEDVGDMVDGK